MEKISASENRSAFTNLFSLYTYELALTSDHSLGTFINENGQYIPPFGLEDYFNGRKEAYILTDDRKAIGFITSVNDEDKHVYLFEEAFLIFPYRNQGIMTALLDNYLKDKHGTFQSHLLKKAVESQNWFEKYLSSRNLKFTRADMDDMAYMYTVSI